MKPIGWSYIRPDNKRFCRNCNNWASGKPRPNCTEPKHFVEYKRHRDNYLKLKANHPEWILESRRKWKEKLCDEVLHHYGDRCVCCGFSDFSKKVHGKRYLSLDYIAGGHNRYMKEMKKKGLMSKGTSFGYSGYAWLKKNCYPPGYRILCRACNSVMAPNETVCELHKWEREKALRLIMPRNDFINNTSMNMPVIHAWN
jgi:hypothetical protein